MPKYLHTRESDISIQQLVEENKRLKEIINALEKEAQTDFLTQLLNKNGLNRHLPLMWAFCKRNKQPMTIMMIDIDDFKTYNDTFGHCEGDVILKGVADCIKRQFKRETDIMCRFGGEEFIVCLIGVSDEHTISLALGLCKEVEKMSKDAVHVSVSVGITEIVPQDNNDWIDLIESADRFLYEAKSNGKNCVSFKGLTYKQ
jgi:diguanylate cyclase (GGDEF)-like protein